MSIHSNQAGGAPSAPGRKKIMGANPTYKSAVQKGASGKTKSDSEKAGKTTRTTSQKPAEFEGTKVGAQASGFGSGHYVPNK